VHRWHAQHLSAADPLRPSAVELHPQPASHLSCVSDHRPISPTQTTYHFVPTKKLHNPLINPLTTTSTAKALLGDAASEALGDLQRLWALAEGYGYADWLVFDASVVRGLAYYTGGCGVVCCAVLLHDRARSGSLNYTARLCD